MKKITQSFYKDMLEYIAGGSCGHIMKKKWIDDELIEIDNDNMKLGCYFEYIFTEMVTGKGTLPKDKRIPRAEYLVASLKKIATLKVEIPMTQIEKTTQKLTNSPTHRQAYPWDDNGLGQPILGVDDMLAPYRLAHANASRLKEYFDLMGIKVLKAGRTLVKGNFEGTVDLICEATKDLSFVKAGERFVIDLKYSGLLNDKWSPYGWAWTQDQKNHHGIQAKHYSFITLRMPFLFWVVSSNSEEQQIFKVEITDKQIEEHINEANYLKSKLDYYNSIGWVARPEINKCSKCPLNSNCKDKAVTPSVKTIEL